MTVAGATSEVIGTVQVPGQPAASPVTRLVLTAGRLRAEIWDLGATLVSLAVPDRDGVATNVVRSRGRLDEAVDPGDYFGVTVGRYANRIARGRFTLDGVHRQLATNDPPNHLHGGTVGFDRHVWRAQADAVGSRAMATLRHVSPDGDEGYPGTLDVTVRYVLDERALTMFHEATTDAPTIVNLTNHAYWNLAGEGSVDEHLITLGAHRYLPVDPTGIPTGGPAPVEGTRFDLTTSTRLGDRFADGGFDHCYLLDHASSEPAATLVDPASGRRMDVHTDQGAVQLYTAEHLDPPRTALCLETQCPPDTPNRPDLGSAVLRPGQRYRHTTIHRFSCA